MLCGWPCWIRSHSRMKRPPLGTHIHPHVNGVGCSRRRKLKIGSTGRRDVPCEWQWRVSDLRGGKYCVGGQGTSKGWYCIIRGIQSEEGQLETGKELMQPRGGQNCNRGEIENKITSVYPNFRGLCTNKKSKITALKQIKANYNYFSYSSANLNADWIMKFLYAFSRH